jgi:hypothetical protein
MPVVRTGAGDPTTGDATAGGVPPPVTALTGITSKDDAVNAYHLTDGDVSIGGDVWAALMYSDSAYRVSDISTKILLGELSRAEAAALISQMRVIEYLRKRNIAAGPTYGFSANAMERLDDRLTTTAPNGKLALDYTAVGVLNVAATQDNMRRLDALEQRQRADAGRMADGVLPRSAL